MKIAKFNDVLALLIILACVALWLADPIFRWKYGFGLPDQVVGGTIGAFYITVQYYFRKKEGKKPEGS